MTDQPTPIPTETADDWLRSILRPRDDASRRALEASVFSQIGLDAHEPAP